MKTQRAARFVVAALLLAAAATPVLADKGSAKADKNAFPRDKLNCGENYVLGAHRNDPPPVAAQVEKPKSLTDAQIADVLAKHMDDVQYCWNRLPAKARASDASVMIALSVAPKGDVIDKTLVGDAPAEAKSCIANVVERWQFPAVERASDVEYPIALRAVSVRAR